MARRAAKIYPPHPPTLVRAGSRTRSRTVLLRVVDGQLQELQPYAMELEHDQVARHLRVWYKHTGPETRTLVLESKGIENLRIHTDADLIDVASDLVILERLVFPLHGGQRTKGELQTIITQVRQLAATSII